VNGPVPTVAEALAGVAGDLEPELATKLRAVCRRAGDVASVAIAGRVSSGKSTLLNALVGRRVAPTDAGECTQVVARFRYGSAERVVVHLLDGTTAEVGFDEHGRIPDRLGVPLHAVDHIEVFLANRRLRRLELVDTPGVSSATEAGARAERFLGFDASQHEVARADAVIYVLTHTGRADEADDLAAFGAAAGGRVDAAIGVLGKADLVAGGDRGAIADLAGRLRERLAAHVTTVVPLWTLVAETVACGRFREADAETVAAVAALDETDKLLLGADVSLFVDHDVPVDHLARRRLRDLLTHTGVVRGVGWAEAGVRGAAQLADRFDALSGRALLERELDALAARADVLRAARMLADAEALGFAHWAAGAPLRDAVERLRAHPDLHVLDETAVVDDLRAGRVPLPESTIAAAVALLTGADAVADVETEIDRWRAIETLAGDPHAERVARTVVRTLTLQRKGRR
jgi:hypothetical protein